MYEQYLRDPASVSDDWRQLFDNGRLAELPVIPTDRAEVPERTQCEARLERQEDLLHAPDRLRDRPGGEAVPRDDPRVPGSGREAAPLRPAWGEPRSGGGRREERWKPRAARPRDQAR